MVDKMDDNQDEFISNDDIEEVIELDEDVADDIDEMEDVDGKEVNNDEIYDVVDESIGNFIEHNEAVLCCDVSLDDRFVVTGGQDDKAIVWETNTQKTKFQINHKDSVVAAKFNVNSTFVATGDMSGNIQVLDLNGQHCYDYEVDDLNWMLWHPIAENVLLAGTKTGDAWMWKLSKTNSQCKTFQSFGSENLCANICNDGKRVVMGYEDGSIRLWSLKDSQVINTIADHQAHKESVICIDINSDDSLIATGSTDSTVKLINMNSFKVVLTISIGESSSNNTSDSVESIAFNDKNLLAIGSVNGIIEIWDVANKIKRSELKLETGVSKISIDKTNPNILYCGCLDSNFRIIDMLTGKVLLTKTGHTDHILDYAISSDSKYVLTCSEDSTAKIFSLTY